MWPPYSFKNKTCYLILNHYAWNSVVYRVRSYGKWDLLKIKVGLWLCTGHSQRMLWLIYPQCGLTFTYEGLHKPKREQLALKFHALLASLAAFHCFYIKYFHCFTSVRRPWWIVITSAHRRPDATLKVLLARCLSYRL